MLQISSNVKSSIARITFAVVFSITAAGLNIFGQVKTNLVTSSLSDGQVIERKLKGDESHLYNIALTAGQYLRIIVVQKGVDVVVTFFGADDKKLVEVDSPNGTQGPELLSFIAETTEIYRLEVRSPEKTAAGWYKVKIGEIRTAQEKDKNIISAQQASIQALTLFIQGTSESRKNVLPKYEEALQLYRNVNDRYGEATTLHNIGEVYTFLGERQKVFEYYKQAVPLLKAVGDDSYAAITLENIGIIYFQLGENQKALDFYTQALPLRRAAADKPGEAVTLTDIGSVYADLGEPQKALDYYTQSLPLFKAVGDRSSEATTLTNIGLTYFELGENQKALDFYTQALPLRRAVADKLGEATTLRNIGGVYSVLDNRQKALEYYNQALTLFRAIEYRRGEAATLSSIGLVYSYLGEKQKALEYFNQALPLRKVVGDKRGEGVTLTNLGSVYADLGETQKALDYYTQSLPISGAAGDKRNQAQTLNNLQNVWSSLGNSGLAIFYGKQSVNKYQELRQAIQQLDKETQESYLKIIEPTYRKLANNLIYEGQLAQAQAVLDLLKEEEFKQIVRRSGEPLFTLPYSKSELDVIGIVDKLAAHGRELSELKAKPKDTLTAEETTRLNYLEQTEIPAANKALRLSTEALAKVAPDVKDALDLKMKDNIQTILPALGKGVVALYTVIGKTAADENAENKIAGNNKINVGWILLVTPEFRKAYPIDTKDLEQTVFKFRESLRSSQYDPQPLAAELYKKLFLQTSDKQKTTLAADLETYLDKQKDKTLMWSLDGVLRYVPMAALHDGKGYLVEKYRNVVFNTASLGTLKDTPQSNWEVVGLGVSTEGTVKSSDGRMLRFSALKGSESELNSIIKEKNRATDVGIFSGTLKINKDFTKEALFEGARTGMPVMHISSHFYFNTAQEETSFLLLGNGGRLEMTEFQDYPNLFSNVDFLSLSACDTATGGNANNSNSAIEKADIEQKAREANGKEIEGFAYRAQTLGAKSVMASLWQVSDIGTRELMLKFYQIRKAQPDSPKGEALRQAQLSLLHGTNKSQDAESREKGLELVGEEPKAVAGLKPFKKDEKMPFAHPYYWSSFILIGNWR